MRSRSLLSAGLFAVGVDACLPDLPPAAQCPPDAKQASNACAPQIQSSTLAGGCVATDDPNARACCGCNANACPTSAAACYPDGDCPRAVNDQTHLPTTCRRLVPEAFQGCVCGCAACLSVCDGVGPVIAMHVPDSPSAAAAALAVQLPQPIASSGRLGVYVRLRGEGGLVLDVGGGAFGQLFSRADLLRPVPSSSGTEFKDVIVWEPRADGGGWPAWHTANDAPTSMVFAVPAGRTNLEIDCIVPFVTAP
jgi:hypothetical protein